MTPNVLIETIVIKQHKLNPLLVIAIYSVPEKLILILCSWLRRTWNAIICQLAWWKTCQPFLAFWNTCCHLSLIVLEKNIIVEVM